MPDYEMTFGLGNKYTKKALINPFKNETKTRFLR